MTRRMFIALPPVVLNKLHSAQPSTFAAISFNRQFSMVDNSADYRLTSVAVGQNRLYAAFVSRAGSSVVTTDLYGKVVGTRTLLPGRAIFKLHVNAGGGLSIVERVHSTGMELVEYTSSLAPSMSSPIADGPIDTCFSNNKLLGLFADGSLGIRNKFGKFDQIAGVMPRIQIAGYTPPAISGSLEPMAGSKVSVIDRAIARVAIVDPQSGAVKRAPSLSDPDVQASVLSASQQIRSNLPREENGRKLVPAIPNVIHLAAVDQRDQLYCLLSPITLSKGPMILRLSEALTVDQRFRCVLPVLDEGKRRVPMGMRISGRDLFLVFPRGEVAVYTLP